MCALVRALALIVHVQVGPKAFPRVAMDLATTVERIQQNFVICDPSLPDCPIVFASDAFLELTGYPREEVLGRNCRFLQVGFFVGLFAWEGACRNGVAGAGCSNWLLVSMGVRVRLSVRGLVGLTAPS